MSAAPKLSFPEPQELPQPQRPDLQIHQPAPTREAWKDDIALAGMLIGSAVFGLCFFAFLVVPNIGQWLAL